MPSPDNSRQDLRLSCKHFLEHKLNKSSYSDMRSCFIFDVKLVQLFIYVDGYFPPRVKNQYIQYVVKFSRL